VAALVLDAGGLGHEAGGLRPPQASPAPIPRRRLSLGTDARHRVPVDILGFAEYGHFFVYKPAILLTLGR